MYKTHSVYTLYNDKFYAFHAFFAQRAWYSHFPGHPPPPNLGDLAWETQGFPTNKGKAYGRQSHETKPWRQSPRVTQAEGAKGLGKRSPLGAKLQMKYCGWVGGAKDAPSTVPRFTLPFGILSLTEHSMRSSTYLSGSESNSGMFTSVERCQFIQSCCKLIRKTWLIGPQVINQHCNQHVLLGNLCITNRWHCSKNKLYSRNKYRTRKFLLPEHGRR